MTWLTWPRMPCCCRVWWGTSAEALWSKVNLNFMCSTCFETSCRASRPIRPRVVGTSEKPDVKLNHMQATGLRWSGVATSTGQHWPGSDMILWYEEKMTKMPLGLQAWLIIWWSNKCWLDMVGGFRFQPIQIKFLGLTLAIEGWK